MNKTEMEKNQWNALPFLGGRFGIYAIFILLTALIVITWVLYSTQADAESVAMENSVEIYGTSEIDSIYIPFHLHIDPMERLLLINFSEDPDKIYVGFEPQLFNDEVHGQGMLVIGWRVDGRVDVYHQPSLNLDPGTYDIAGAGLAQMLERPLENAYFEVKAEGVDAYFAFDDALGRPVEVTIQERNRRQRRPFGLLAPMGNAATSPSALPLVLLHDFYFVRRADTTISIKVAGQERQPDTLPLPVDGTRMYFTRYSPAPLIATLNPAQDGLLLPAEEVSATEARRGEIVFDLVENHGRTEIAQMRRAYKEWAVNVAFNPPIPSLINLRDGAQMSGIFTISADASVGRVTGEYQIARQGDEVQIRMWPSQGWQPNERKWSVRLMYWLVSDFTAWPRTYQWTASLDLADPEQVTLKSSWRRVDQAVAGE